VSALVALGLRLARAGGPLRAWSIAAGNAVGVVLLLVAAALPTAVYPDAEVRAAERVQLMGILVFLLVPAVVLLVTVGRLSSGVRDRRLAALRMLGVGRHQARVVAAVENGALALVGALAGAALFATAAPAASRLAVDGRLWLQAPLRATPASAVATVLGVVALSVVVGTRQEATRRRPRPWRLAVLATGLAALVWLGRIDPDATADRVEGLLFFGGTVVTAVGIALTTPWVTAWLAHHLARTRSSGLLLAGRAIQTDSVGAARLVAGLGVALFLTVGALGGLGATEALPQNRYATQVLTDGPQAIRVTTGRADEAAGRSTFDPGDASSLAEVEGVLGVSPVYPVVVTFDQGQTTAFAGTCAQLALVMEATGCDDSRAARIVSSRPQTEAERWVWWDYLDVDLADQEDAIVWAMDDDDTEDERAVDLSGPPIVQHVDAQLGRWVYRSSYVAFVPLPLVADLVGRPSELAVVAVGGAEVQQRVAAWAEQRGYVARPHPRTEYDQLQNWRAGVLTLCGVVVGVGLLVLALTAADRASERRRPVARLVAAGVPPRVLRLGQLVQTLLPTVVAAALALGSGVVALRGYASEVQGQTQAQGATLVDARAWGILLAAVTVGALLVALATVPLIRTRLSPELLRRE
jgi:hypothetical protein